MRHNEAGPVAVLNGVFCYVSVYGSFHVASLSPICYGHGNDRLFGIGYFYPPLFLRAVLVIWEQRDLLPDAYVSTVRRAACIMVLLYHFPLPALCGLCPVGRIPFIGGCRFREALMEELHLLRLLVHFRIDPEIAHIRIPAVAAVVHYGVRIIRELQPGTFLVIKWFPCLSLYYGSLVVTCVP